MIIDMVTMVWLDEWQVSERAAVGVTLSVGNPLALQVVSRPDLGDPSALSLADVYYREADGYEDNPRRLGGVIEAILEIRAPYDGPYEVSGARESCQVHTVPLTSQVTPLIAKWAGSRASTE